jgi:predicted DNA-binding antitoxin AbrB/MazE fold protein
MDHLPRKVVAVKAAPKRKPLKKLEVKEGLKIGKDLVLDTKAVAKKIMSNIADAADSLKAERKQFTPAQAAQITTALKGAMEAEHVCGDGSSCKHDTTMTVEPVEKPSGRKGVRITIA